MKTKPELRDRRGLCESCRQEVKTLTKHLRESRKAGGRCACGNELPRGLVTPLGRPVENECLECYFKRGSRRMKPLVVTAQADRSTGQHRLFVTRRAKPVSLEVSKKLIEYHKNMAKLGQGDLSALIDWTSIGV